VMAWRIARVRKANASLRFKKTCQPSGLPADFSKLRPGKPGGHAIGVVSRLALCSLCALCDFSLSLCALCPSAPVGPVCWLLARQAGASPDGPSARKKPLPNAKYAKSSPATIQKAAYSDYPPLLISDHTPITRQLHLPS
jgi:hypothetical protein